MRCWGRGAKLGVRVDHLGGARLEDARDLLGLPRPSTLKVIGASSEDSGGGTRAGGRRRAGRGCGARAFGAEALGLEALDCAALGLETREGFLAWPLLFGGFPPAACRSSAMEPQDAASFSITSSETRRRAFEVFMMPS